MFDPSDTIVAVATPPTAKRSILRISGPQAQAAITQLSSPPPCFDRNHNQRVTLELPNKLNIEAQLYLFLSPHSYTGQDLIEIHLCAAPVIVQYLMETLLAHEGLRRAGPGEYTVRAYLNGKLDLAQAEAVYEIIHSTNSLQIQAAQGLLQGRLAQQVQTLRTELLECLSLLEAGMDFSEEEDVQFISEDDMAQNLQGLIDKLNTLLNRGLSDRETVHLPSVGIAGAPNAGKSSLFNALLGQTRSIVSSTRRTTRDVLAGRLTLTNHECILFDSAGLLTKPKELLDRLAQEAALESLSHCHLILFCVDPTKTDWTEDIALLDLLPQVPLLRITTKADLAPHRTLPENLAPPDLTLSAQTGHNLATLKQAIDHHLTAPPHNGIHSAPTDLVALTARHRQALTAAINTLQQAIQATQSELHDVCALLIRTAYQHLSETSQHVSEDILEQIFSRFCIGK